MKAAALTLLLLAPGQDLEELLRRLSDEAIDVRSDAVDALAALGPERLPELRARLDGLDPEARSRLAEAIGRIEAAVRILDFLPPVRPVSLDFKATPGRKALEEWSRRTGVRLVSNCFASSSSESRVPGAYSRRQIWSRIVL